jgi:phage FluMu gp28-like protein
MSAQGLIPFRPYQREAFLDRTTGIECWLWSRQIGKSYTLAAWSVDRLLTIPGRLVVVLSNSRDNGAELVLKCADVCVKLGQAYEQEDVSPDGLYENMIMEVRIKVKGKVGRIKVLAASPRTARGFSGDLILDEFGFHENSYAIWDAAEPILSSNPGFLCRIASTPNGKHNMLYQICTGGLIPVRRVPRSLAWQQGLKVYHPVTRQEITPAEARELALDKRSYDQNYELVFEDENMALLTLALIAAAERSDVGEICQGEWSPAALARMRAAVGPLYLGVDVGRIRDLTVMAAVEKLGQQLLVRGVLRLENVRLPQQQMHLGEVCRMPRFSGAEIDMTGLGLGLVEYSQEEFGAYRVRGVNFSSTVPTTNRIKLEGRVQPKVRVTEALATNLLGAYEDRRIQHPCDRNCATSCASRSG